MARNRVHLHLLEISVQISYCFVKELSFDRCYRKAEAGPRNGSRRKLIGRYDDFATSNSIQSSPEHRDTFRTHFDMVSVP